MRCSVLAHLSSCIRSNCICEDQLENQSTKTSAIINVLQQHFLEEITGVKGGVYFIEGLMKE